MVLRHRRAEPIAKGESRPHDASRRSFLDLPGEIRNKIYDLLCKQDTPVYLHDASRCIPKRPLPPEWPYPYNVHTGNAIEQYVKLRAALIAEKKTFRHNLGTARALLSTCRQIYQECVPQLYSENVFVISRSSLRCDEGSSFGNRLNFTPGYHQVLFAPRWLRSIGTNVYTLTKVIIDADSICPEDCFETSPELDLLPLISLLWQHPRLRDVVSLAHSGRFISTHHAESFEIGSSVPLSRPADKINKVLAFFHSRHTAHLPSQSLQGRLLDSIVLSKRTELGYPGREEIPGPYDRLEIQWYGFYYGEKKIDTYECRYDRITLQDRDPLSVLLPDNILARISNELECNTGPDEVILDLDQKAAYGLHLFHRSLNLTKWCTEDSKLYDTLKRVIMRAQTFKTVFDFDSLSNFKELYGPSDAHANLLDLLLPFVSARSRPNQLDLTFEVHFKPELHTKSSDIRINLKNLLSALGDWDFITDTILSIRVACQDHVGDCSGPVFVNNGTIRKHVFLLLCTLAKSWPEDLDVCIAGVLPDIWMNGLGEILGAGYHSEDGTALFYVQDAANGLSDEEVFYLGYSLAMDIYEIRQFKPGVLDSFWPHETLESLGPLDYNPFSRTIGAYDCNSLMGMALRMAEDDWPYAREIWKRPEWAPLPVHL